MRSWMSSVQVWRGLEVLGLPYMMNSLAQDTAQHAQNPRTPPPKSKPLTRSKTKRIKREMHPPLRSLSLRSSLPVSPPTHTVSSKPALATFFLPKLPLTVPRNHSQALFCTSPKHTQQQQQRQQEENQILQFVAESSESTLPCVRTFENDSARLCLVGSVRFEQALTAAAADGGRAADEHIHSGVPAMVVETVFPGPGDDHATISTRLFLPPKKVKEKARKLKSSLSEDLLSGSKSENILAMTFRQVVLQQLSNFELVVFRPGAERNMEDLENPREVPVSFTLSSTNEHVISVLAEAVCDAALQNTEAHYLDKLLGKSVNSSFNWFQKPRKIVSKDQSVTIYKLFEDEIIENAKALLENFNSTKQDYAGIKVKQKHNWWPPLVHSKLEKISDPEFRTWTSEYVPAYRLQIDADKVKDVKFDGWKNAGENRWEVLLTHSQMVGLAEILDMLYDDRYSLPNKELSCGVVTKFDGLSNKKRSRSLISTLSMILASGVFFITIGTFAQFFPTYLRKEQKFTQQHQSPSLSESQYPINEVLDDAKLQEFCVLIVKKIKDAFNWPADIVTEERNGAFIGKIPEYLKMTSGADSSSAENLIDSTSVEEMDENMKSSAQSIASYQVILSTDGKIVGFQPTSRTGVNHWAANPLAKELYGGRKLRPGFLEPGLKIRVPKEVAVIELLMSTNSDVYFALARPLR